MRVTLVGAEEHVTIERGDLDDFFHASVAGEGVSSALPDGVRVTFDLSGEGGGTWTVCRDRHGEVEVYRHAVSRPDCRRACDTDAFIELISGRMNVRKAFLDNRIKVSGDVGLVWRLHKVIVARQDA